MPVNLNKTNTLRINLPRWITKLSRANSLDVSIVVDEYGLFHGNSNPYQSCLAGELLRVKRVNKSVCHTFLMGNSHDGVLMTSQFPQNSCVVDHSGRREQTYYII